MTKYSRPVFVFWVSLVYFALYSIAVVHYQFYVETEYLKDKIVSNSFTEPLIYGLESFERAFFLIFFLTAHRLVFAIFLPALFLLSAVSAYFIYIFKIQITERIMPVFFEATPPEISAFISMPLVLWCALAIFLACMCVWLFLRHDKKDTNKGRNNIFVFVAAAFTLSALLLPGHAQNTQYMPYNYLKSSGNYFLAKYYNIGKQDISSHTSTFKDKDITVIMVIGESARGDHFSLNGYERVTNPELSKVTNLVNFTSATSCDNLTRLSVPCMLTRATKTNREPTFKETSFISTFRKLGFDTVWIDNQQIKNSFIDSTVTEIIKESETIISPDNINLAGDTKILPFLDGILDKHKGKLLIVIHTIGSHWPYDNVYNEGHKKWNPICKNARIEKPTIPNLKCDDSILAVNSCYSARQMSFCDSKALINSYDNSILQTDYFLSEVINRVKNRNSLLLYSSDHGESLGEEGFLLHGQSSDDQLRPEQFNVPLMFWGSDEFIKNNKEKFKNVKSKSGDKVSHDIIFHSILDCAGVESEVVDKNSSICN